MSAMRLYHNPRCSKSRQALALLEERGIEFEIHRYLDLGVLEEDLDLLSHLDGVVRRKEAGKERFAGLKEAADVRKLLAAEPKVLERPILVHDGQAVIGRPPEEILQLLS
jgi:arsenate reductase